MDALGEYSARTSYISEVFYSSLLTGTISSPTVGRWSAYNTVSSEHKYIRQIQIRQRIE